MVTGRYIGAVLVAVVLAVGTACAPEPDRGALTRPSTPSGLATPEGDATHTPGTSSPDLKITRCAEVRLPQEGVGDADFAVDAAKGLLGIHFGDTRTGEYQDVSYTVRYLRDPSCRTTPKVADLIGRVDPPGWFPAAGRCQILGPNELPNGAAPGEARPSKREDHEAFLTVWGNGGDRVIIGRGWEVLEHLGDGSRRFPRSGGEEVVGRDGIRRWVMAVGDPPLGEITYKFVADGCPYVLWTQSGMTWTDALAYASRLATSPYRPRS